MYSSKCICQRTATIVSPLIKPTAFGVWTQNDLMSQVCIVRLLLSVFVTYSFWSNYEVHFRHIITNIHPLFYRFPFFTAIVRPWNLNANELISYLSEWSCWTKFYSLVRVCASNRMENIQLKWTFRFAWNVVWKMEELACWGIGIPWSNSFESIMS